MFGLSFSELVIIVIIGIMVVGPRKLPTMMRTAGQWVAKLRRMSIDLRAQSGIDDLIRQEGLEREIGELRALSRVNVIDTFVTPVMTGAAASTAAASPTARAIAAAAPRSAQYRPDEPLRDREYPLIGCDSYDAEPDDALAYAPAADDDAAPVAHEAEPAAAPEAPAAPDAAGPTS